MSTRRSRPLSSIFLTALLILSSFFFVARLQGQGISTAQLNGTVHDQTGAVIPNVTISISDASRGFTRSTTTDGQGNYQLLLLPPGTYTVTVNAVADLIKTQRSSQSTTVNQVRIDNLPTNGRNYINFTLTNSQIARDAAPAVGAIPTSGLNFGGVRARSNSINVDGADAGDYISGGTRSTVSQDAVQEFQIITNGFAAEYGRASGGVVNIVTKSGTNTTHGSAYR